MGHFNFWLSLSLSDSLSETLNWTLKSGLRPKFNLTLDFSESQKVHYSDLSYLFHTNSADLSQLVRLNFGLSMYLTEL